MLEALDGKARVGPHEKRSSRDSGRKKRIGAKWVWFEGTEQRQDPERRLVSG